MPEDIFVAVLTGWDLAQPYELFTGGDVHYEGNNDAWRLVDQMDCRWVRYHLAPGYFDQPRRYDLEEPDIVFNLISDVDQNPKTLNIAEQMTAPFRGKLINDPQQMRHTGRDEVARLLGDVPDLVVPRVLRLSNPTYADLCSTAENDGFSFPAIVRHPGTHSGSVLGVFDRVDDLQPVLAAGDQDLILTEFRDFRSPDGFYRKMRLFFVGEQVIFRHLLFSQNWNVHARDRIGVMADRPDLLREEQAAVNTGGAEVLEPVRHGLEAIQERMNLDYFGIDCALTSDGKLLIFEINATMNFFPFLDDPRFTYLHTSFNHAKYAMNLLLQERLGQRKLIDA